MPNYVINKLQIEADDITVEKILETIKDDEVGKGSIDFNKLIPMPKELDIEDSLRMERGLEIYKLMHENRIVYHGNGHYEILDVSCLKTDMQEFLNKYANYIEKNPDIISCGKMCFEYIEKYGAPTWYDWRSLNWGSKWNAKNCIFSESNNEINFKTAWSAVPNIIAKIAEKFPSAKFIYRYASEDMGYELGMIEYAEGKQAGSYIPDEGSKTAIEYGMDLWDTPSHMRDHYLMGLESEDAAPATYVKAERLESIERSSDNETEQYL
jgi:hypothetical protein